MDYLNLVAKALQTKEGREILRKLMEDHVPVVETFKAQAKAADSINRDS